jgi:hypothetical protein
MGCARIAEEGSIETGAQASPVSMRNLRAAVRGLAGHATNGAAAGMAGSGC